MPVKVTRVKKSMQGAKQLHRMKLCTASCFICEANRRKKEQQRQAKLQAKEKS